MIDLQNVSMYYPKPKRYKDYLLHPFRKNGLIPALSGINLTISEGDAVGFLGPNGAGKTTLLKLVGGLLYPSRGSVIIGGYNTVKDNHKTRGKVGYVLNEERSFYWRLTAVQNLEFFGSLDNLYGKKLSHRINELLKIVGLESLGNIRVSNYSSGMRQRLAIARGLMSNPDILILDEPTRAIDPLGSEQLRRIIIRSIKVKAAKILLIATHQCQEAEQICNKICIIYNGRVLGFMSLKEIQRQYGELSIFYKNIIYQNRKLNVTV